MTSLWRHDMSRHIAAAALRPALVERWRPHHPQARSSSTIMLKFHNRTRAPDDYIWDPRLTPGSAVLVRKECDLMIVPHDER